MLLQSDVRNLRLKHSKIEQDDITKVEQFINSLNESGGDVAYVLDESTGVFQYLVYIFSMENLISRYPEVLIMDATYKTHHYLLPLLTIMCHDQNGADHPVLHAFIRHEDKTILGTCLDFLVDRYDSSQIRTIYLWTKLKIPCSNSFQAKPGRIRKLPRTVKYEASRDENSSTSEEISTQSPAISFAPLEAPRTPPPPSSALSWTSQNEHLLSIAPLYLHQHPRKATDNSSSILNLDLQLQTLIVYICGR
ncbi:hypothetical protein RRG08_061283 [Elysia crispata]|uniref:ZSWIM1/3 RNaseH-like domain-containing protein n=1 Tax=Elysia crispata TaxID=231223 RepID=A0AAE1CXM0_9GAST|nr:hypothetical protein RRG08_061283 [Elysia crispata]